MPWFYVDPQGSQQGPVDDQTFNSLVSAGSINAETLVWQEGMPEWLPYNQAVGQAQPAPVGAPPVAAAAQATPGQALVPCPTCGLQVPGTDLIPSGPTQVCPSCKETHLQTLLEGKEASLGTFNFAGFWIRFVALFIDSILLMVVQFGIGFLLAFGTDYDPLATDQPFGLVDALGTVMGVLYYTLMHGNPRTQATLGKMVVGLRVITEDGGDVSYARAFGRYLSTILSTITLLIGYIMAGFDEEKRALHDRIAGTRVVYK